MENISTEPIQEQEQEQQQPTSSNPPSSNNNNEQHIQTTLVTTISLPPPTLTSFPLSSTLTLLCGISSISGSLYSCIYNHETGLSQQSYHIPNIIHVKDVMNARVFLVQQQHHQPTPIPTSSSTLPILAFIGTRTRSVPTLSIYQIYPIPSSTPLFVRDDCPGLSDVIQLPSSSNSFIVVTGLGLGVVRVWLWNNNNNNNSSITNSFIPVANLKAKYRTIISIVIDPTNNNNIYVASDGGDILHCQIFSFPITTNATTDDDHPQQPISISSSQSTTIKSKEVNTILVLKNRQTIPLPPRPYDPNEWINLPSTPSQWKTLFSSRELNPFAYEGEYNDAGLPHGLGQQTFELTGEAFIGQWMDGIPISGKLFRSSSNTNTNSSRVPIYEGEVMKNGLRHGWGKEMKSIHGGGIEIFTGYFQFNLRHGLGWNRYEKTNRDKNEVHGTQTYGFYYEGKKHGLSWLVYDSDAATLPFADGMEEEIKQLDRIKCIVHYENGLFYDEFHFSRLDGKPLVEEHLFNLSVMSHYYGDNIKNSEQHPSHSNTSKKKRGPDVFAPKKYGSGRYLRNECWKCLQRCNFNSDDTTTGSVNRIQCVSCGMMICKECQWPEMFKNNNSLLTTTGIWLCGSPFGCTLEQNRLLTIIDPINNHPVIIDLLDNDDIQDLIHGKYHGGSNNNNGLIMKMYRVEE
jgi:hypothetical protein